MNFYFGDVRRVFVSQAGLGDVPATFNCEFANCEFAIAERRLVSDDRSKIQNQMPDIFIQTIIIMAAGVLGCIIPALPGPPLVFLGAIYYAWKTGWNEVSWPSLSLLFVMMLIGATSNFWLSFLGTRKSGASVWTSVAAFVGGLIGLIVFSLPGLFIGALGAIAALEYSQHKDWSKVMKAGKGYLAGYLLSMIVELAICIGMIIVFLLAVHL